ncbi:Alpha/beta hydrolase fold-3 [Leptodontidium sp. MPI-SDFR-AT-0119]|nr:Alpha/beta hydrolase fold-3 [Leptodontidium sp. MPI-SDFR-AT-0119]
MGILLMDFCFLGAKCVVVTAEYRLAPENPFPAAVDDAVTALKWVVDFGKEELGVNPTKVAVGGSSSGGNLATVLSLLASTFTPSIPLTFLLLTIPVIDQTATAETSWSSNANAPWLTPARMTWYRDMYLTHPEDSKKWTASPNLAPKEILAKSPSVWMGVSECDILFEEGKAYAELLRGNGVEVECVVYPGSTHSILSLDGKSLPTSWPQSNKP